MIIKKKKELIALDHNISPTSTTNQTTAAPTTLKQTDSKHDDGTGKGTVGCVCMLNGHVAAATSTGGMTNKMSGRIGDTPIIGAGTYADKHAALSATGHGEEFIRNCAAYTVVSNMRHGHMNLQSAMDETVFKVLSKDSGGMIGVDSDGNVSFSFNCPGMFRGYATSDHDAGIGIWENVETFRV